MSKQSSVATGMEWGESAASKYFSNALAINQEFILRFFYTTSVDTLPFILGYLRNFYSKYRLLLDSFFLVLEWAFSNFWQVAMNTGEVLCEDVLGIEVKSPSKGNRWSLDNEVMWK